MGEAAGASSAQPEADRLAGDEAGQALDVAPTVPPDVVVTMHLAVGQPPLRATGELVAVGVHEREQPGRGRRLGVAGEQSALGGSGPRVARRVGEQQHAVGAPQAATGPRAVAAVGLVDGEAAVALAGVEPGRQPGARFDVLGHGRDAVLVHQLLDRRGVEVHRRGQAGQGDGEPLAELSGGRLGRHGYDDHHRHVGATGRAVGGVEPLDDRARDRAQDAGPTGEQRLELGRAEADHHARTHGTKLLASVLAAEEAQLADGVAPPGLVDHDAVLVEHLHQAAHHQVDRLGRVEHLAPAELLPAGRVGDLVEQRLVQRAEDGVEAAQELAAVHPLEGVAQRRRAVGPGVDVGAGHPGDRGLGRGPHHDAPEPAGQGLEVVERLAGPQVADRDDAVVGGLEDRRGCP